MSIQLVSDSREVGSDAEVGLSPAEFKAAFRNHPAGVALLTAEGPNGPVAMTVSSLVSVSAEPALMAFSLSDFSNSSRPIRDAGTIVVHLLDSEHVHLAKLGAERGVDRFADTTAWSRLEGGEPYFHSATNRVLCRVVHEVRAGTATVIVAHALETVPREWDEPADRSPLVYHNRQWHALGASSEIS
jgi:flavin reductase (DIM6/NTAB) family NADH-FMN oxidoreductase RutF